MTRVEKFKHYFQAFSGREIEEQELSRLCSDFSQLVVAKVIAAPEIPGAKEFVGLWHEHTMCFVNSAVPTAEIREIVKGRGLEKYFYEILLDDQVFIFDFSKMGSGLLYCHYLPYSV